MDLCLKLELSIVNYSDFFSLTFLSCQDYTRLSLDPVNEADTPLNNGATSLDIP